ncbi:GDP/GTP exchange factor for ARF, partial [Cladochytrium tenue]
DALTLHKATAGLHRCSSLASAYAMHDILDAAVSSLARVTGLLRDDGRLPPLRELPATASAFEEAGSGGGSQDKPAKVEPADPWAVEFGRSFKAQIAAVLLFNIAAEFGNSLREGWASAIEILGNLFVHSLLPVGLLTADEFSKRGVRIPRIGDPLGAGRRGGGSPARSSAMFSGGGAAPPRRDNGLFSTLTQLLSLSTGSGDDSEGLAATPEEVEAQRFTMECVTACHLEELFLDSRFLEEPALICLVEALIQLSFVNRPPRHTPRA